MSAWICFTTAAMPGGCKPFTPPLGGDVDALDLGGVRRDTRDFGLEDQLSIVDPNERPPAGDELLDPAPIVVLAGALLGRDTHLLGVHRNTRGIKSLKIEARRTTDCGIRRDEGWYGQLKVRLAPPQIPGDRPVVTEYVVHRPHRVLRAEDRGHVTVAFHGPTGEGNPRPRWRPGPGPCWHQRGRRRSTRRRRSAPTSHRRATSARVWSIARGSRRTR